MSEAPEQQPVAETQQPVAEQRDYAAEVEMLKAQNHKVIGEKKAFQKQVEDMQRQLTDLQNNQQPAKQSKLAEAGEFKTLWTEATATVSSLQDGAYSSTGLRTRRLPSSSSRSKQPH